MQGTVVSVLVMTAGVLLIVSGALPAELAIRCRQRSGQLVGLAVLVVIIPRICTGIPIRYIGVLWFAASAGAYVVLEARRRRGTPPRLTGFINYRTTAKVRVEPTSARDPTTDGAEETW